MLAAWFLFAQMARLLLRRKQLALLCLACIVPTIIPLTAHAETLVLPPGISAWDKSLNLRFGLRYKDNLLLSEINRDASPFVTGGLEPSLVRLLLDGTQILAFI